jgi:dynamin 1-like protein
VLLPLINKFCTQFNEALDGRSPEVSLQELYGGARISYVFRELFAVAIDRIRPFDRLTDADIRTAIRNASGPRPSLFIPEVSFELLVKMQIERLLIPSLDCVDLIFHELQRMAMQCEQLVPALHRFPSLRTRLMECSNSLLRDRVDPTKLVIQNLIDCELAYINTSHPDFIGGSVAVANIMESYYARDDPTKKGGPTNPDSRRPSILDTDQQRNNRNNPPASTAVKDAQDANGANAAPSNIPTAAVISSNASTQIATPSAQPQPGTRVGGLFSSLWGFGNSQNNQGNSTSQQQTNLANEYKDAYNGSSSRTSGLYSYKPSRALDSMSAVLDGGSLQGSPAAGNFAPNVRAAAASDRELIETSVIKALINSYFNIVKKNVCDLVPKAIMAFLVNTTKSDLQSKLVSSLYKPTMFEMLLKEADDVAEKRASCEELLSILHRAMNIINEARNYNALT